MRVCSPPGAYHAPDASGTTIPARLRAASTSAPTRTNTVSVGHWRQPRRTSGGGTPNRWIRSKIAASNSRGTAISAIWKITYPECVTTLAPILISFSRSVVNDQCLTDLGNANRRRKFLRFYAGAKS
jgi:hypothetical protein